MTKTIDTLVDDIYGLFDGEHEVSQDAIDACGAELASVIAQRLGRGQERDRLRLSQIGQPDRKVWLSLQEDVPREELEPWTKIKFLYGDILEVLLLFFAEQAGHTVKGKQDELDIEGVKGHRDAVIDGVLVDVKSASTFGFKKFKDHTITEDDPFGYLHQIAAYQQASPDVDKERAGFLAIDKQHGHITLCDLATFELPDAAVRVSELLDVVSKDEEPEPCYDPVPDGASGNMKLDTGCSYCHFKQHCWPNMRTFLYSNGPRYLTHVEKEPRVAELLEDGSVKPYDS